MRECRSMREVREHIDSLDRRIVELLAERSGYVHQAARIKTRESDVRDERRIEDVVARVRDHGVARGLDPDLAERVYRAMIDGFIALEAVEYERFHRRDGSNESGTTASGRPD